ncbi:MAG: LPS export ABC transporter periplasmic protein LptC, partial [Acidobacteria bacterium]|nr:LPS export ABC transporter periplasmic protein LptC [Acidobacteriota bacterium]
MVAVGATYSIRAKYLRAHTVGRPKSLPAGVVAAADEGWHYSQTDAQTGKPIVEVHARGFQQTQDPPETQLDQVELRLFDKTAVRYDEVKCAKATFVESQKRLYSEGNVEIRMGIPAEGAMKGRLVSIQSSGVTFQSDTGKASTDRPSTFHFEGGDGKAVGAEYDPTTHILQLKSAVELNWRPVGPRAKPMKIEAGELIYRELEAKIYLSPWSRLTRDTLKIDGGEAHVTLQENVIRNVDAQNARGTDTYPNRTVEFQASRLFLTMDDDGLAKQLTAEQDARLVSKGITGEISMAGDKVDLDFNTDSGESQLTKALAQGHSVVTSKPVAPRGQPRPETRIMRSEVIYIEMRPGGHEIQRASTMRPGDVEFVPNAPGQRHRSIH